MTEVVEQRAAEIRLEEEERLLKEATPADRHARRIAKRIREDRLDDLTIAVSYYASKSFNDDRGERDDGDNDSESNTLGRNNSATTDADDEFDIEMRHISVLRGSPTSSPNNNKVGGCGSFRRHRGKMNSSLSSA